MIVHITTRPMTLGQWNSARPLKSSEMFKMLVFQKCSADRTTETLPLLDMKSISKKRTAGTNHNKQLTTRITYIVTPRQSRADGGKRMHQIQTTPDHDHHVIQCTKERDEHRSNANPTHRRCKVPTTDRSFARELTQCRFHDQQWNPTENGDQDIGNNERCTAILKG